MTWQHEISLYKAASEVRHIAIFNSGGDGGHGGGTGPNHVPNGVGVSVSELGLMPHRAKVPYQHKYTQKRAWRVLVAFKRANISCFGLCGRAAACSAQLHVVVSGGAAGAGIRPTCSLAP
jgi:hypothetical protein